MAKVLVVHREDDDMTAILAQLWKDGHEVQKFKFQEFAFEALLSFIKKKGADYDYLLAPYDLEIERVDNALMRLTLDFKFATKELGEAVLFEGSAPAYLTEIDPISRYAVIVGKGEMNMAQYAAAIADEMRAQVGA